MKRLIGFGLLVVMAAAAGCGGGPKVEKPDKIAPPPAKGEVKEY